MATLKRELPPRILVLCEGVCEDFYLKKAKNSISDKDRRQAISIDIRKSKYSNCEGLVKQAIEEKKKAKRAEPKFDSIWVVFDNDRQESKKTGSLSRAFEMAKANQINIVYSSICWEFWYLLHIEYTSRQFESCDQLLSYLKTKTDFEDYDKEKGYPKAWEKLLTKLSVGSSNAKKLRTEKQNLGEGPHGVNPWVNVDVLVQYLLEI
jgi:hypothetical protein